MASDPDHHYIRQANELARTAVEDGNFPFGALLVQDAQVIETATNTVATDRDIIAHPELKLSRVASQSYDLQERTALTLYTSTEPCPMCAGAIYWAGIGRVVYSTAATTVSDESGDDLVIPVSCERCLEGGGRNVEVVGPILEEEGLAVHRTFWTANDVPDSPVT